MSKLADYGTVVMASIAHDPERTQSAADVAERTGVAEPTVGKILKRLAKSGLVVGVRGARGGYRLARLPAEISMAEIIRAMEDSVGMTECSRLPGRCVHESCCAVRTNWQEINRIVLRTLQGVSLEQMIQPMPHMVDVGAIAFARRPAA